MADLEFGASAGFRSSGLERFKGKLNQNYRIMVADKTGTHAVTHTMGRKYYHCLGEGKCPACAAGLPKRDRYGVNIVEYALNPSNGQLLDPLEVSIKLWAFGYKVWDELGMIAKNWGGLSTHDLSLHCTAENFQAWTIIVLPQALSMVVPGLDVHVAELYKNNAKPPFKYICREVDVDTMYQEVLKEKAVAENQPGNAGKPNNNYSAPRNTAGFSAATFNAAPVSGTMEKLPTFTPPAKVVEPTEEVFGARKGSAAISGIIGETQFTPPKGNFPPPEGPSSGIFSVPREPGDHALKTQQLDQDVKDGTFLPPTTPTTPATPATPTTPATPAESPKPISAFDSLMERLNGMQ
jgi:hypothetical protein